MTTVPVVVPWKPWQAWRTTALWIATAHLALGIGVTAVCSAVVIAALTTSASLLAVPGLGIFLWTLLAPTVIGLGTAERARFRVLLGVVITTAVPPASSGSRWRDATRRAVLASIWRGVVYWCVRLPVSLLDMVGLLLAWTLPLTLLFVPVYARPDADGVVPHLRVGPFVIGSVGAGWVTFGCGLVFLLLVGPLVVRLLLAMDVGLARTLLKPSVPDLRTRVRVLETSRAGVVDAGDRERRRIERDLHDGAQQRLVALAMTLGRAQRRLGTGGDPAIRSLLAEARAEAGQAMAELRGLARGLHPPVLTDLGLDAALSAVAARLPVPVTIDAAIAPRPTLTIESVAYFVVCEALTNVAKHANATRAWVRVTRTGDRLRIEVRDDGVGGANPTLGSGLTGLADRVAGVDGHLSLHSPAGGPTTLRVELPCGS